MGKGFESSKVWSARGRGFSMGLVAHAGHTVHLTGQVAWDNTETIIGPGDVAAQTAACFDNIQAMLDEVGGELCDLVSVTTWFMERQHLPAIQQVRARYLAFENPPVSTSVMVAGLGHPDFMVELTAIAVVPDARFLAPPDTP
jgi:enamine deaminase RidA (YjgF/YER057c/UK114 family)